MIIKCEGNNAWGGRTTDYFVVEGIHSLDELNEYIKNEQPIKCKEVTAKSNFRIIWEEELMDRIVYLNNYLKISEPYLIIMNKSEREAFYERNCNKCTCGDGSLSGALRCDYIPSEEGGCLNFDEVFSLKEWLKSIFKSA